MQKTYDEHCPVQLIPCPEGWRALFRWDKDWIEAVPIAALALCDIKERWCTGFGPADEVISITRAIHAIVQMESYLECAEVNEHFCGFLEPGQPIPDPASDAASHAEPPATASAST